MYYQFEILRTTRNNLLKSVQGLSMEELHQIPKGFNNNIAWNFNHTILVQQLLCYKLSGLDLNVPEEIVKRYSKGTKASAEVMKADFELCKSLALQNVDKIEKDYSNKIFENYKEYTTSYNITLKNVEEAISFNNTHEGLHLGYIMAIKRAIK